MNDFKDFLKYIQNNNNIASTPKLFEFLGGEKKLNYKYRNFALVAKGELSPKPQLFMHIFEQLPSRYYKKAIESFFKSHLEAKQQSDKLFNYLQNAIKLGYDETTKGFEELKEKPKFLSEEQLEFLTDNEYASRIFNKLFLFDTINKEELRNLPIVNKMIDLDLAKWNKDGSVGQSDAIYFIPTVKNSSKATARKGANYLRSQILNNFTSDPTSEKIEYVLSTIPKNEIDHIKEQIQSFVSWIQSKTTTEYKEGNVGITYLSCLKTIEKGDI